LYINVSFGYRMCLPVNPSKYGVYFLCNTLIFKYLQLVHSICIDFISLSDYKEIISLNSINRFVSVTQMQCFLLDTK